MKLSFLAKARDDLKMAVAHYEDREEGLGTRFRDEVSQASNEFCKTLTYGENDQGDADA